MGGGKSLNLSAFLAWAFQPFFLSRRGCSLSTDVSFVLHCVGAIVGLAAYARFFLPAHRLRPVTGSGLRVHTCGVSLGGSEGSWRPELCCIQTTAHGGGDWRTPAASVVVFFGTNCMEWLLSDIFGLSRKERVW